jgi:hypothetical protein
VPCLDEEEEEEEPLYPLFPTLPRPGGMTQADIKRMMMHIAKTYKCGALEEIVEAESDNALTVCRLPPIQLVALAHDHLGQEMHHSAMQTVTATDTEASEWESSVDTANKIRNHLSSLSFLRLSPLFSPFLQRKR